MDARIVKVLNARATRVAKVKAMPMELETPFRELMAALEDEGWGGWEGNGLDDGKSKMTMAYNRFWAA